MTPSHKNPELAEKCMICGSPLIICLKCSGYGFARIKKTPAIFCPKCEEKCPRCGSKPKEVMPQL